MYEAYSAIMPELRAILFPTQVQISMEDVEHACKLPVYGEDLSEEEKDEEKIKEELIKEEANKN